MSTTRFNAPPGWPQPPQGWQPDPNWRPDPSWPPAPPGWQWWVADPSPYQAAAWPSPLLTSAPRSNGTRNWLTVAIVLGPYVLAGVLGGIVGAAVGSRPYSTDAELDAAISNASDTVSCIAVICFLIGYAFVAGKVSYRWFDTFFLLVPIYSIIWQFKIAHRLAYLPHKDWAPRPEEMRPSFASVPGWPTR